MNIYENYYLFMILFLIIDVDYRIPLMQHFQEQLFNITIDCYT